MTTPELSGYKFETYKVLEEIWARPHIGTLSHYATVETYLSMVEWRKENIYPIINFEKDQVIIGNELEFIFQFEPLPDNNDEHFKNVKGWQTDGTLEEIYERSEISYSDYDDYKRALEWGFNTRIALRHKSPAQQNDTNVNWERDYEAEHKCSDKKCPICDIKTNQIINETVEQAVERIFIFKYGNYSGDRPKAVRYGFDLGFEEGAQWQSQQSQSDTIKAVLEYVVNHAGELIYSDNEDDLRYGLLSMQTDIEKQLKKVER